MNEESFILILSCTGGAGHLRAAEALHRTAPLTGLPIRTETYDVLDFTSAVFKRVYSESYLQVVKRAPELWGYLYLQSERRPYRKSGLLKLFDEVNYKNYLAALKRLRPAAIICTHFLPFISVGEQLRRAGINAPLFAATTDFDVHQLWVNPFVQEYFVFHEESKYLLERKMTTSADITTTGIPVQPEFGTRIPASEARAKLGLQKNAFTVLVLAGGFGVGHLFEITRSIGAVMARLENRPFNLLVVCGKNPKAQSSINKLSMPHTIDMRVFGFVGNIHELMDAADVLVSKSGGLTSAEAMAKQLPMLIIDPIPGQEARNADLLVEHGAGWKAPTPDHLEYKLQRLLQEPDLLVRARASAKSLGKPNAAQTILRSVYRSIGGNPR
ncbi:MAG: glycosyltransferase [Ignavibacteriales bacterium]|nr:glycosyltransferase [Ignavibacteriales bacterium]